MTTITLALPLEPAAEAIAARLAALGAQAYPLPLDLIESALVEWSAAELTQLILMAPSYLASPTPAGMRLGNALYNAAAQEAVAPPLRTLRDRRRAARKLARRHRMPITSWMLSTKWTSQIGCNLCQLAGPDAPCWGQWECHGYQNGCGCIDCNTRARIAAITNEGADND